MTLLRQKRGSFSDKAHKYRGSFSEMHEKIGAFRAKMAKNFSIFRQICRKFSKKFYYWPKIVTCLTIKCENEVSLSDKDVSGSFGEKSVC